MARGATVIDALLSSSSPLEVADEEMSTLTGSVELFRVYYRPGAISFYKLEELTLLFESADGNKAREFVRSLSPVSSPRPFTYASVPDNDWLRLMLLGPGDKDCNDGLPGYQLANALVPIRAGVDLVGSAARGRWKVIATLMAELNSPMTAAQLDLASEGIYGRPRLTGTLGSMRTVGVVHRLSRQPDVWELTDDGKVWSAANPPRRRAKTRSPIVD